jgi:hypothetical protein
MSILRCETTGCLGYKMQGSDYCSIHGKSSSVTDMKKLILYKDKVCEAEQVAGDVYSISRYDSDQVVMSSISPAVMTIPSHAEMREYVLSKSEHEASFRPGMEPVETSFSAELGKVLCEMESLLTKKNKDYGSSYDKTVEELGETVILVRIMDKFNRLKQLLKSGEPAEVEETIEETLSDLVGYGIIELVRRRRL